MFISSLLSVLKVHGWSLKSFQFNGTATRAKFGMKREITLHKPKNDPSSVAFVGSWSMLIAPVVCEATSWRLCRKSRSR